MVFQLSREILVLAFLVACQLMYSQVYPLVRDALPEAWRSDERVNLAEPSIAGAKPDPTTLPASPELVKSKEATTDSTQTHRRLGKKPKFRLGQVVRDKLLFVRGVVSSWDMPCRGSEEWRKKRLVVESWAGEPCYGLLVDLRDATDLSVGAENLRSLNLTEYVPEATLESLPREAVAGSPVVNPLIQTHFRFFDEGRYIPEQTLIDSFPDDVSSHYAHLDSVESNEKGQPLLRITDFGRLIAHGASVPVIRKGMFLVATAGVRGDLFTKAAILVLEHRDSSGTLGVIINKKMLHTYPKLAQAGRLAIDQAETTLAEMQGPKRGQVTEAQLGAIAKEITVGRQMLKLMQLPAVDVRIGGPVGLEQFPLGAEHHMLLHRFTEPKDLRKTSKLAVSASGSPDSPDLFFLRLGELKKQIWEILLKKIESDKSGAHSILFVGNSAWGPLQLAGEIRGGLGEGSSWGWIPASPQDILRLDQSQTWARLNNSHAIQFLEPVE